MKERAFIALFIGSIIAGFTGLFIKNIETEATSIAFVRTGLPSLLLGIWMYRSGFRFFRGNYKRMLLASILNAIRMYLFLLAFIYTTITQAVIMLFTWPIFVNIFSTYFLKEKLTNKQLLVLCVAFTGIIIIYGNQPMSFANDDFIGMSAGVLSAFFYSMSYIIYKKEVDNYHRNEVIFYQNLIGAIIFSPFFFIVNPFPKGADYVLLPIYAILMGIVIFNFFFYGLKYIKASQASLIAYVEIVSATAVGVLFMGDKLTPQITLGGLLILSSVALLRIQRKKAKKGG